MSYKPWEMALGAVVLAVALIFGAFAVSSTGARVTGGGTYPLHASFRSAEGVRPGTEVRLAGVRVGQVSTMRLDPASFRAHLTVMVDNSLRLPADTTIQIASEGLLGGTFVELIPGGALEDLEPGSSFDDTQSALSLINLLMRFVTGSGE